QEIVGYPVSANSPYLKRGLLPSWARPTLVVREQKILAPPEPQPVRAGDYVYVLAPPEKAQALDRFFVDMPPPSAPDPRLLGDFFVSGDVPLGALADIYGLSIARKDTDTTLADHFAQEIRRRPKQGDIVPLGPIALVAHRVTDGRLTRVGLRLGEKGGPAGGRARFMGAIGVSFFVLSRDPPYPASRRATAQTPSRAGLGASRNRALHQPP